MFADADSIEKTLKICYKIWSDLIRDRSKFTGYLRVFGKLCLKIDYSFFGQKKSSPPHLEKKNIKL